MATAFGLGNNRKELGTHFQHAYVGREGRKLTHCVTKFVHILKFAAINVPRILCMGVEQCRYSYTLCNHVHLPRAPPNPIGVAAPPAHVVVDVDVAASAAISVTTTRNNTITIRAVETEVRETL